MLWYQTAVTNIVAIVLAKKYSGGTVMIADRYVKERENTEFTHEEEKKDSQT